MEMRPLTLLATAVPGRTVVRAAGEVVRTLATLGLCGPTVVAMTAVTLFASPLLAEPANPPRSAPKLEIEPPPAAAGPAASASAAPGARPPESARSPKARLGATSPEPAQGSERLVWDKAPLQIVLGVGPQHERAVTFSSPMHFGVPAEVAPLLRVQTVGRTTYLTAMAPFPRTRVVAEDRATGAVTLLDLTAAAETAASTPIEIVTPAPPGAAVSVATSEDDPPVDMVTLTRHAARQLYAPRRLAGSHPRILGVPFDATPSEALYAGAMVLGTPLAQWRADGLYVTAVLLQSRQSQPVELSPLDVRGRWRAITFQHGRLLPQGSEADQTVVYLVCDQSFESCR